jgi:hypothetical protein
MTLAWMVSRMIDADVISKDGFDREYIEWLWQLNKDYNGAHTLDWVLGKLSSFQIVDPQRTCYHRRIDEAFDPEFWLTHSRARTPGQYWRRTPRRASRRTYLPKVLTNICMRPCGSGKACEGAVSMAMECTINLRCKGGIVRSSTRRKCNGYCRAMKGRLWKRISCFLLRSTS